MKDTLKNITAHMNKFCLDIGTRHCGSDGERQAAQYIEDYWRSLGLDVRREEYPVRGWKCSSYSMYNVTKGKPVGHIIANYFSASCDVTGVPLIIDGSKPIEELDVAGRICFIRYNPGSVFDKGDLAEKLESLGAAAAIFMNIGHTDAAPSSKIVRTPHISKIATLAAANQGIHEILANANDTYRLTVDAQPFDTVVYNVIAKIGSGDVKGVIGAHFDTAPLTQGAGDNASGTAAVMEMARILRGYDSGMTLEFAAFSAEEYIPERGACPPGSADYVARHKDEDIRWFYNIDDYGLYLGSPEFQVSHEDKLPKLNYCFDHSTASLSGDDKTFSLAGIPTVWLYDRQIFRNLHTPCDTIETVDCEKLAKAVEISVDMVRQLADGTEK